MRGSIYYQTAQLTKIIFKEGASKVDRINPDCDYYLCIASFNTMNSYRQIWNNFGKYLRAIWKIKNFELIEEKHVVDYIESKIDDGCSLQYIQKINASLSKLAIALQRFNNEYAKDKKVYIFKKHILVIAQVKKCKNIESLKMSRAYKNPKTVIANIKNKMYRLAASIQYEGGARYVGIRKIELKQLKGRKIDEITGTLIGVIETKEKGGRVGDIFVTKKTYDELYSFLYKGGKFNIIYQQYEKEIVALCLKLDIDCNGSHGFRWSFARKRLVEYQNHGFTYEESLRKVSFEMKHNRKDITEHYC